MFCHHVSADLANSRVRTPDTQGGEHGIGRGDVVVSDTPGQCLLPQLSMVEVEVEVKVKVEVK
eukprot:scaffold8871_cov90-Cyclotella_meneghiniana.AAC.4